MADARVVWNDRALVARPVCVPQNQKLHMDGLHPARQGRAASVP